MGACYMQSCTVQAKLNPAVGTAGLTQQMPFNFYILVAQPEETDKSMPMALQQPYQL